MFLSIRAVVYLIYTCTPTGVFVINIGRSFTIFTTVTPTGVVFINRWAVVYIRLSRIPRRVAYIDNYERMLVTLAPDSMGGSLYKDRHICPDGRLIYNYEREVSYFYPEWARR